MLHSYEEMVSLIADGKNAVSALFHFSGIHIQNNVIQKSNNYD